MTSCNDPAWNQSNISPHGQVLTIPCLCKGLELGNTLELLAFPRSWKSHRVYLPRKKRRKQRKILLTNKKPQNTTKKAHTTDSSEARAAWHAQGKQSTKPSPAELELATACGNPSLFLPMQLKSMARKWKPSRSREGFINPPQKLNCS